MNEFVIELKNCSFINNETEQTLVKIDELNIKRGDAIFFLGENGSGKTSMIKALFSNLNSDNYISMNEDSYAMFNSRFGYSFCLNGSERTDWIQVMVSYAYIGQDEMFGHFDSIYKSLLIQTQVCLENGNFTIEEKRAKEEKLYALVRQYSLSYFDDIYKYTKKYKELYAKDKKLAEEYALKILKHKPIINCSGGQKKLASILGGLIKAIILEMDVIVLDEPLNHLDQKNKLEISNLLSDIRKTRRLANNPVTFIIISHCLVFDFINEDNCYQYVIKDNSLKRVKNKIYHNCLLCNEIE